MMHTFLSGRFPVEYVPVNFENIEKEVDTQVGMVRLALYDVASIHFQIPQLRRLAYPNTDVVLLCYRVDSLASLESAASYWLPEITENCPGCPIVLCGCKLDLRDAEKKDGVSWSAGKETMKRIGAVAFFECSALTNENITEMFREVARLSVLRRPRDSKCILS